MATVGENRALRDQYNILLRELRSLQEQYNRERPGIGQDLARDIATFRNISAKTNSVLFQMEQLQKQNIQNSDLFDPQLAQGIEQNVRAGRELITASEQVVRQAEQQQQQQTGEKAQNDQGSGAASAGAETSEAQRAEAEAASTQNPGTAPEQQSGTGAISESPTTVVPSNAASSQPATVPEVTSAPPAAVAATPTAQNQLPGTPARGQGVLQPPSPSGAQQFYIYKAIMVTSNFSSGRFTQELEGVLLQIPVVGARRQDGILVPQVPAPSDVPDTTPAEAQTRAASAPTVVPDSQSQAQAPPGDPTVFGPAETAPPDSDGQPVATAQPSGAVSEGSATTTVGGFTIKAVVGPGTGGAAFTVSRGGSIEFAFGAADIYNAAVKLVLAGKGGNDQEVLVWVNARGPQILESQALGQVRSASATPNSTPNMARET